MTEVEGRVLPGLDEFMLRVGHLMAVVNVARDSGASWRRIEKETAELFLSEVPITDDLNFAAARYLAEKDLCRKKGDAAPGQNKPFRYPDLEVSAEADGELRVYDLHGREPKMWWQDRNLAHPDVPSRVGAVTVDAKFGSKTGLSHIADWCQLLEVVAPNGQLRPSARLLCRPETSFGDLTNWNPYLPGPERLLIAKEYISRDFDIFRRLVSGFAATSGPMSKSACRALFVEAIKDVVATSQTGSTMTSRQRFELQQQLRDLERAAKKVDGDIGQTSTAWHRTASRVETMVDIGLLEKGHGGEREKYQYVYYPSRRLKLAAETLRATDSCTSWLDEHFLDVMAERDGGAEGDMSHDELIADLAGVVRELSLPTSLLPIDTLVIGICIRGARGGLLPSSLREVRQHLESLPELDSQLARLSRGRSGTSAEFISINLRRLSEVAGEH